MAEKKNIVLFPDHSILTLSINMLITRTVDSNIDVFVLKFVV